MSTLPVNLDNTWIKVKSRKELAPGMVLRIPWPDGALDRIVHHKELKINRISGSGNAVIETPAGGELELDTIKDLYYKKGTEPQDANAQPGQTKQVLFALDRR